MRIFLLIVGITVFLSSCKKDKFLTSPNARLVVTTDSLKFDTVFTTVGSVTQLVKIINPNSQKIMIDEVRLMGGNTSYFQLNIDGVNTPTLQQIELAGNDSVYVFVSVTINPSTSNLPFIISDSIRIRYNNNTQFIVLEAYGKNAHFLRDEVITGIRDWSDDLPYVITGSLQVDTSAELIIHPGTKVYVHGNTPFNIDGTLRIAGTKAQPVIFSGDRLDAYYKDLPGSWKGLDFRSTSENNSISFAVINNATKAISVTGMSTTPKLSIHQTIINNAAEHGLYLSATSVLVDNSLLVNSRNNITIVGGGDYAFTHCTMAGFSNNFMFHNRPSVTISNIIEEGGVSNLFDVSATFTNCIVWGEGGFVEDELITDKRGNTLFEVQLKNCLLKVNTTPDAVFQNVILNQNPMFDSIDVANNYYDFRINNATAPPLNQGVITGFTKDLDDNNRNVNTPDLGCYEKQ